MWKLERAVFRALSHRTFLIHWPISVIHLVWLLASPEEALHLKLQFNHHHFAVNKYSSLLKQLQPEASYKALWAQRAAPQSDTLNSAIASAFKTCCSPLKWGRQCELNSHPPFGAQPHQVQWESSKLFRPNCLQVMCGCLTSLTLSVLSFHPPLVHHSMPTDITILPPWKSHVCPVLIWPDACESRRVSHYSLIN